MRHPDGVDSVVQRGCLDGRHKFGSFQSIDGLKTLRLNEITKGGE